MPLVTITLSTVWSLEDQHMIADGIHEAIVGVGFPQKDRFQKIHRLPQEQFIYDDRHPNLTEARSEKFVLVEIVLSLGRSVEFKKDLVTRIVQNLETRPGIAPHDVMVLLIETARENWAFASGVQYYIEN
ncbi:MAG: tautomerase family protein [Anaerolineae bacterium]|nr:tautomerase family protein [Anaerolineae bacterium]